MHTSAVLQLGTHPAKFGGELNPDCGGDGNIIDSQFVKQPRWTGAACLGPPKVRNARVSAASSPVPRHPRFPAPLASRAAAPARTTAATGEQMREGPYSPAGDGRPRLAAPSGSHR